MQTDYHYYAIYAICRMAGMDSARARTIAYASQYVDDADDGRPFPVVGEPSGKPEWFNPVLTAHKTKSIRNFYTNIQTKIHLCFHFLPHGTPVSGGRLRRRDDLTTRPACAIAEAVLDAALGHPESPDRDVRLGIALHSYADTWAHQHFSGLNGPENDVEEVTEKGPWTFRTLFHVVLDKVKETLLPAIGHAEANDLPDLPYKKWKYYNYYLQRDTGLIDNTVRYLTASEWIFQKLGGSDFNRFSGNLKRLFEFEGDLEVRCRQWKRALAGGALGFVPDEWDRVTTYDPRDWFSEALAPVPGKEGLFKKQPGFEQSPYAAFQRCARQQREEVLNRVRQAGMAVKQAPFAHWFNKIAYFLRDLTHYEKPAPMTPKIVALAGLRFFIYGAFMIFTEISFYSIIKAFEKLPVIKYLFLFQWRVDPTLGLDRIRETALIALYGQASLWMFLVYGVIGLFFIEPLYRRLRHSSLFLRGLAYMVAILAVECGMGWLICYGLLDLDIWYYTDAGARGIRYTSLYIAPMWFLVGLMSENLVRFALHYGELERKSRSAGSVRSQ